MLSDTDRQMRNILFIRVLVSVFSIILLEIVGYVVNGLYGQVYYYLNVVFTTVIYALSGFVCMNWFFYVHFVVSGLTGKRSTDFSKKAKFFICLPAVCLAAVSFSSPFSNLIFYIDPISNLKYHGDLFILQQIVTYSYVSAACILVFVYMFKTRDSYRTIRNFTLNSFIIFPTLGGFFTLILPGPSVVWVLFTLGLVFVFFDMRISNVSQDGLTRLNSRRVFDEYLACCINEVRTTKNLYLIMIDINSFKQINDEYGHLEGDNALILIADVMRKVCDEKESFLARFGGDEFAILHWGKDEAEVFAIEREILANLRHQIYAKKIPYKLTISIGFEERGKECIGNISAFIKKADRALYKAKNLSEKLNSSFD